MKMGARMVRQRKVLPLKVINEIRGIKEGRTWANVQTGAWNVRSR